MGNNLLPNPNKQKHSFELHNDLLTVASSRMQGWRQTMEDKYAVYLKVPRDSAGTSTSYFGVFDGHGGLAVSQFVAKHLHKFIVTLPEWSTDLGEAIKKAFLSIDEVMRQLSATTFGETGTTAITVFIRENVLYCGNVGDSRAIAYKGNRVIPLSFDHKPSVVTEYSRIIKAGGFVENDRVNGSLAVSRALGDYKFKLLGQPPEQQLVSPVPEIVVKGLDRTWEFIVLASDGIWEVMSSRGVAQFVKNKLRERKSLKIICEDLLSECISRDCRGGGLGCDNMTVIIIKFSWAMY